MRDYDDGYHPNYVADAADRYASRRYYDDKNRMEGFCSSGRDLNHVRSRHTPNQEPHAFEEDYPGFSRGRGVKRAKWHHDRSLEGRRVGKKFFKPQRPPEAPLDLWCRVCNRHFQDTNSKLSHDKSKKHRKAVEEAREREEHSVESDSQPDVPEKEAFQTHLVETNVATNDRVAKMLESGAHARAPKPFRDWVNRSIAAARARGDSALVVAVCKEVAEELYVQNERSTIHLTNWATRENASGLLYLGGEPVVVKIPLFDAKEAETGVAVAQEGYDEACAIVIATNKHHQVSPRRERDQEHCKTLSFAPQRVWSKGSADPRMLSQQRVHQDAGSRGGELTEHLSGEGVPESSKTDVPHRLSGLDVGRTRIIGGDVRAMNTRHESSPSQARGFAADEGRRSEPGYRCRPAPPQAGSVCLRRRNSSFCPSSSAGKRVRNACTLLHPSFRDALGIIYERDYARPEISHEPCSVGNVDLDMPERISISGLQKELDGLYLEFDTGYNYADFSSKLQSLVGRLEERKRPFTTELRRAYELQVEAALLQDRFGDIVYPCAQLMDVYSSMRDVVIRRRDEFIAYYCISLLLIPSTPESLLTKYDDREYRAIPGLLAKCLAAGPRGGLTEHAISVVTAALNGHWTKFFRLRAEGLRNAEGHHGLEMAMDALIDVVRSMALHTLLFSMDHPPRIPLREVMERLKWYFTGHESGSKYWQVKEAREFVSKAGCQLEKSSAEDTEDGSSENLVCRGEKPTPSQNLKTVLGAVDPNLFPEYKRALQRYNSPEPSAALLASGMMATTASKM
jgi:hypothetical protein